MGLSIYNINQPNIHVGSREIECDQKYPGREFGSNCFGGHGFVVSLMASNHAKMDKLNTVN